MYAYPHLKIDLRMFFHFQNQNEKNDFSFATKFDKFDLGKKFFIFTDFIGSIVFVERSIVFKFTHRPNKHRTNASSHLSDKLSGTFSHIFSLCSFDTTFYRFFFFR